MEAGGTFQPPRHRSPPRSLCLAACGEFDPPEMQKGSDVIRKQIFMLMDDIHR